VIDPGPDVEDHVRALASTLAHANEVTILLTHGHPDHAAAASALAAALHASVAGPGTLSVDRPLRDGDTVATDAGELVAVATPGHTREHMSFHWPERRAVFVGDHLLGQGDTTWVAEYEGCVADYLDSLDRLRRLEAEVLYPAHGPPLLDPAAALDRFEEHRRARVRQVEEALAARPDATAAGLVEIVYGSTLPRGMEPAALQSLEALVDYVTCRVRG
jgi:glyoxylase-like metal-dependent hydrolase (beta-lactamase superfamily II)